MLIVLFCLFNLSLNIREHFYHFLQHLTATFWLVRVIQIHCPTSLYVCTNLIVPCSSSLHAMKSPPLLFDLLLTSHLYPLNGLSFSLSWKCISAIHIIVRFWSSIRLLMEESLLFSTLQLEYNTENLLSMFLLFLFGSSFSSLLS